MSQPNASYCHGSWGVDVQLVGVGWKLGRVSHFRGIPWRKPGQGSLAHHYSYRVLAALLHTGADPLLSTGGTWNSGEGSGEQDCHGNGTSLRPSRGSERATIISPQRASYAQTSPHHLTLPARPPTGRVVVNAEWNKNRPESALILNLSPRFLETDFSTLIPRGIRGDRKGPEKPVIRLSQKSKPGITPRQKED